MAIFNATTFTKFAKFALENLGVPWAIINISTSSAFGTYMITIHFSKRS